MSTFAFMEILRDKPVWVIRHNKACLNNLTKVYATPKSERSQSSETAKTELAPPELNNMDPVL
jgi:hypothetical protein